jgi:hypothetical protein
MIGRVKRCCFHQFPKTLYQVQIRGIRREEYLPYTVSRGQHIPYDEHLRRPRKGRMVPLRFRGLQGRPHNPS